MAVLKPEVHATPGAPADLGLLASNLRISSVRGLLSLQGLSPKSLEETDSVPGLPSAVARALSADEVVSTKLDCRPADCRVSLSRIRGRDGAVLWAGGFDIPPDAFAVAAGATETRIRQAYSERSPRRGAFASEAGDDDLREFLTLYRRFESRQEASGEDLLQRLEALRTRAPRFLEVYLLENEVARFQHFFSRRPEVLRQAFTVAEEARKMAPEETAGLRRALLHRPGGRGPPPGRAGAERVRTPLSRRRPRRRAPLRPAARPRPDPGGDRADADRGRPPGLLQAAGEPGNRRVPAGGDRRRPAHLEASLRRAPGNFDALSALGQLELQSGDPGRARELYQALVRRSPGVAEVSNLGLAELLTGRYAEAAEAFRGWSRRSPATPSRPQPGGHLPADGPKGGGGGALSRSRRS